jgi:trehalose/maltose hydrolase-like predicted phosphorylase
VFGFAGLRIHDDGLLLRPCIPQGIRSYRFRLMYRQTLFEVTVTRDRLLIRNVNHVPEKISVYGNETLIETSRTFPLQDVDSV